MKQYHQVMTQQRSASEPFGQKVEMEEGMEEGVYIRTCASVRVVVYVPLHLCVRACGEGGYVAM